jgi:hypothetical protein
LTPPTLLLHNETCVNNISQPLEGGDGVATCFVYEVRGFPDQAVKEPGCRRNHTELASLHHTNNHEFRMTLFWLLCVCLVLAGLAYRRAAAAVLNGLRLQVFGVRVRVSRPQRLPCPPRAPVASPRHNFLPPPRTITRAGP